MVSFVWLPNTYVATWILCCLSPSLVSPSPPIYAHVRRNHLGRPRTGKAQVAAGENEATKGTQTLYQWLTYDDLQEGRRTR